MPAMNERVSLGAAGKQRGVGGGDIRRAGYTKVATARPGAWEHEPPVWLHKVQAERASIVRAAALAWAAFLNAPTEPGPDG